MNEGPIIYEECVEFTQEDWDKAVNVFRRHGFAFRREMYGEFLEPTPEQKLHTQIAQKYHDTCDAYDRWMCSGISPRSGEPMPATPFEHAFVDDHARQVRRELIAEYRLTDQEFHRIITTYKRR